MTAVLIGVACALLYVGFHAGHGHANYRHSRAQGGGLRPSLYLGARGPYVTVRVPGTSFRLGHRL